MLPTPCTKLGQSARYVNTVHDIPVSVGEKDALGQSLPTLARRIASLASSHRLLGLVDDDLPTSAAVVRNALRGDRRRKGAAQR